VGVATLLGGLAFAAIAGAWLAERARYERLEERIEAAMPRPRGGHVAGPAAVENEDGIVVALSRLERDGPGARMLVSIGEWRHAIPAHAWTGDAKTDEATRRMLDGHYAEVQAEIARLHAVQPDRSVVFSAASDVPNATLLRVFDCVVAAGETRIEFDGSVPIRER
jgi:hypothetical protein